MHLLVQICSILQHLSLKLRQRFCNIITIATFVFCIQFKGKNLKPIQQSTLSQPIYDTLKEMIINNELKPGEKIIQEKIAAQLGVSRTPLMRALQMLEHEMLLENIPRRGMYVRKVSIDEMIDFYYCRESIECMATRLATKRASDEDKAGLLDLFKPFLGQQNINLEEYRIVDETFHSRLIHLSQNPVLEKMSKLSNIHDQVYRLGLLRQPEETLIDHKRIIEAMIAGDVQRAETEIKNHIKLSRETLENYKIKEQSNL